MLNSSESPRLWGLHMARKVYTWLIWVCSGIFLVCTWFKFDCLENHGLNTVILLKNNVGIIVPVNCGALNYNISQKF